MAAGCKSITTTGSPQFPGLFSHPGLVVPNHQHDVTVILQNCTEVDMEIPRCTVIGFIENLRYPDFNEISMVNPQKGKKKFRKMHHCLNPLMMN